MTEISAEWYASEADRWKSIAEANDRSYCIARDALDMTRKALAEMTTYRDNASQRLAWAERDKESLSSQIRRLKADLSREKKARRALAPKKKSSPKRSET